MARCGCSSSGCACVLEDLDTSTVDLTISGAGSFADPYIISADISISDTAGNILTSDGTGLYVPTPAPFIDEELATFERTADLSVGSGNSRYRFPFAATLLGVTAAINTAPTGASVILDVNKNGTTVYTTQANRPTILAGANATAAETVPDVTAIAVGDYLTIDIDQIGSTVAGADATVFIRYRRV